MELSSKTNYTLQLNEDEFDALKMAVQLYINTRAEDFKDQASSLFDLGRILKPVTTLTSFLSVAMTEEEFSSFKNQINDMLSNDADDQ